MFLVVEKGEAYSKIIESNTIISNKIWKILIIEIPTDPIDNVTRSRIYLNEYRIHLTLNGEMKIQERVQNYGRIKQVIKR